MALTGRRLLLISNSTVYSRDYLDHVADEIKSFLGNSKTILFVPFALHDRDAYAEKVRMRFAAMGYQVESIHQVWQFRESPRAR
jgi:dipeptidase E